MLHYTLNTGDTRVSPRDEVGDDIIELCGPLLANGTHPLPKIAGYELRTATADNANALMATVFAMPENRPCVTIAVATDDRSAKTLWPLLERHYLELTEAPVMRSADFAASRQPKTTPWCAAMTVFATPDEAFWMADFERCLAWAWIEHCRQKGDTR